MLRTWTEALPARMAAGLGTGGASEGDVSGAQQPTYKLLEVAAQLLEAVKEPRRTASISSLTAAPWALGGSSASAATLAPEGVPNQNEPPVSGDGTVEEAATLVSAEVAETIVGAEPLAEPDSPTLPPSQWLSSATWWSPLTSPVPPTCTNTAGPKESSSSRSRGEAASAGGGSSRSLSAFAGQLADATQRAPQRLAERYAEQLQQLCLEEAGMGLTSFTWDLKLPSGRRSFLEVVAREFVSRVEALGFEKVEWWTGREWRQSRGRFHILHDNVYDKYHMRLRVRWLDRLAPDDIVEAPEPTQQEQPDEPDADHGCAAIARLSMLEQIQHTLELQRQMLEAAIAANSNACAAKEAGQRGAARAAEAEGQGPAVGKWPVLPPDSAASSPAKTRAEDGLERI